MGSLMDSGTESLMDSAKGSVKGKMKGPVTDLHEPVEHGRVLRERQ